MSSDRQARIPAPTAEELGVERVRWRKLGTLTLWTLREVFLRWRGYAALGVIAILVYLLQYGLPLDFIATPWKELFDAAAAARSWLGVPWQDLSQMAGTLGVRGVVCALLAIPVLAAITAAAWMVLLMRRSTGVYAHADLASVITIDAKSQAQAVRWIVSRHLARRKHQGQGVQLREALRAAIVAKYAETDLTIEARVRDERLRILLQRQFPLVQTDGQMLRATPADLTLGDELGRDSSPGTVAAAVRRRAVNRERGSVSAIVAPWGAGKTWIVKHAITMLEFPMTAPRQSAYCSSTRGCLPMSPRSSPGSPS